MRSMYVDEILRAWKSEAKVSHLVLYRLRNGELTIFTDMPGPFIGCRGALIDKYKEKLLAIPYHAVKEVRIEETHGIF